MLIIIPYWFISISRSGERRSEWDLKVVGYWIERYSIRGFWTYKNILNVLVLLTCKLQHWICTLFCSLLLNNRNKSIQSGSALPWGAARLHELNSIVDVCTNTFTCNIGPITFGILGVVWSCNNSYSPINMLRLP